MNCFFKKSMVLFSLTLFCFAEIDIQQNIYDGAEDVGAFDQMLNQLIADHNGIDMDDETYPVEDFEETKDGYILRHTVPSNAKVEIKIEQRLLTISTKDKENRSITISDSEEGYEMIMNSSMVSFSLPENADETSMERHYEDGVLVIKFTKK